MSRVEHDKQIRIDVRYSSYVETKILALHTVRHIVVCNQSDADHPYNNKWESVWTVCFSKLLIKILTEREKITSKFILL